MSELPKIHLANMDNGRKLASSITYEGSIVDLVNFIADGYI